MEDMQITGESRREPMDVNTLRKRVSIRVAKPFECVISGVMGLKTEGIARSGCLNACYRCKDF